MTWQLPLGTCSLPMMMLQAQTACLTMLPFSSSHSAMEPRKQYKLHRINKD